MRTLQTCKLLRSVQIVVCVTYRETFDLGLNFGSSRGFKGSRAPEMFEVLSLRVRKAVSARKCREGCADLRLPCDGSRGQHGLEEGVASKAFDVMVSRERGDVVFSSLKIEGVEVVVCA